MPIVSVWTGGRGDFEQILRVRDADGDVVLELRTPFTLESTSHRHYVLAHVTVPVREGVFTLTVSRDTYEDLLRQDFTIVIAQDPGADQ